MVSQTKAAIIAIAVIIPLSSTAVWNSAQSLEFIGTLSDNEKIVVLASFYPLYEFTKEVGQDNVDVSLIVPSGVEPHDWEPTIQDLQRMQQADIIVINGIGFENWVANIDSVNSDVVIVDTSVGIPIIKESTVLKVDEHDESLRDPHIWLNPVMAKTQVANIAHALIEIDSINEKHYTQNTNSYIKKLDSLDTKIKSELSLCKKDFIAFHQAFSFFANQYGLHQHTILSSTEPHEEPTSKTLEKTIKLAKEFNINIIFTEEAVDTRASKVIANEIGGKVLTLSPLEVVDTRTNYIEKMEQNLSNLKEALCN